MAPVHDSPKRHLLMAICAASGIPLPGVCIGVTPIPPLAALACARRHYIAIVARRVTCNGQRKGVSVMCPGMLLVKIEAESIMTDDIIPFQQQCAMSACKWGGAALLLLTSACLRAHLCPGHLK